MQVLKKYPFYVNQDTVLVSVSVMFSFFSIWGNTDIILMHTIKREFWEKKLVQINLAVEKKIKMDIKAVAHLISRVLDKRTRTIKGKDIKIN